MKLLMFIVIVFTLSGCFGRDRIVQRAIPETLLTCDGIEIPNGTLSNRQISLLLFQYDTNLRVCVANMNSIRRLVNPEE